MEITSNGGEDFAKLAGRFKAAGANGAAIRKALTKKIQVSLARITAEQKSAALGMKVKGTKGHGSKRRKGFHESARLRGKNVRGKVGGYGLRASTARAIKSKVQYTGRRLGAKIYIDASALPRSQRALPKHLDNPKGWRHPVWGNRKKWVGQKGEPYFSKPIERHENDVRRDVRDAVAEVMRTLR